MREHNHLQDTTISADEKIFVGRDALYFKGIQPRCGSVMVAAGRGITHAQLQLLDISSVILDGYQAQLHYW